jgi:hypothetical protein
VRTIVTREWRDERAVQIEVALAGAEGASDIRVCTISKGKDLLGPGRGVAWSPATVNWTACGARSPEYALDFANAIVWAAQTAARLDAEIK